MSDRLFERAVLDWLEDGSDRTPRPAIDAVLLAVKTTPQERGLRLPRRITLMPNYLRAAAGVAIVAIVAIGLLAFINRPGVGGPTLPPATSATSTPSTGPTSKPTSGPTVLPSLAFTSAFSSRTYGYDARAPQGWNVALGTALGTPEALALGEHSGPPHYWDHVTPTSAAASGNGIFAMSTVIPAGMTEDDWIDAYQAPQVAADGRACIPERSKWQPLTVDGRKGGIYTGCNYAEATIFVGGRAYVFYYVNVLASSGIVITEGPAILRSFLATVFLHPELAAASFAPS